jgi:two-component system, chemotaxis family, CheB/CheR fusion protein
MWESETYIADLDEQLREAARLEKVHQDTEAGLREALAYAESIVDTVREPLLILDGELRIKTASRAFYERFGASRDETGGQFLYDLGDGQWSTPALRVALEEVLSRDKSFQDFEVVHDFPRLGRRVMLLNARRLWHEGVRTELVLLAIEDFTERKRMEDEMLRSNEDLQRFAYVAAHDLRSPLNSALSLATLLERRLNGRLNDDESNILALSIQSMKRLGVLMQDILTYAETSNTPSPQTLVPIEESLQIALANLQHHIENNQADISLGTLPNISVDRTQIAMVFQNLIGNALKYRGEEAPRIRVGCVQKGNQWQVSVSDNGQGFEAQYAAQIFEPFKRLHGPDVPGSGIGLATCKRIVERTGGRIWAESQLGIGSTFHFTFPVTP